MISLLEVHGLQNEGQPLGLGPIEAISVGRKAGAFKPVRASGRLISLVQGDAGVCASAHRFG